MTLKPPLRHVLHSAIVALTALATTGVMAATASAATPAGHPGQVRNQASPAYQHTYRHGLIADPGHRPEDDGLGAGAPSGGRLG